MKQSSKVLLGIFGLIGATIGGLMLLPEPKKQKVKNEKIKFKEPAGATLVKEVLVDPKRQILEPKAELIKGNLNVLIKLATLEVLGVFEKAEKKGGKIDEDKFNHLFFQTALTYMNPEEVNVMLPKLIENFNRDKIYELGLKDEYLAIVN